MVMSQFRVKWSVRVFFLAMFCFPQGLFAQVAFTTPAADGVSIASPRDYAREVLLNPWDMDSINDLAEFIPAADYGAGITALNFFSNVLEIDVASINDGYIHFLSPGQCASNALGKNGQALPIDPTVYHKLVMRIYSPSVDNIRVMWYTGCNYADNFRRSGDIQVAQGWQNLEFDLENIAYETNQNESRPWSQAGNITGLRFEPGGSDKLIAWVQLVGDTPAGGTFSPTYSVSASGTDTRYSVVVDDNNNPFDSAPLFLTRDQDANGAPASVTVDSALLFPGSYNIVGYVDDDWATLNLGNPYDFDQSDDIEQSIGFSNAAISGGSFTGTTNTGGNQIHLNPRGSTFSGAAYPYVCFEANVSAGTQGSILFDTGSGFQQAFFVPTPGVTTTYRIDLTANGQWTGNTIRKVILNPTTTSGASVAVNWVAFRRNDGCGSADVHPTVSLSPGKLVINEPPKIEILQPDVKGGADFASTVLKNPWEFDSLADISSISGLETAGVFPNTSKFERQGDFFCATNSEGNGDPFQYSLNVDQDSASAITDRFRNVTTTFYVDRAQDVSNGSLLRIIGRNGDSSFLNGDDTFYRGQRWETLTQDMTKWKLEELLHPNPPSPTWSGNYGGFRLDMHEFDVATEYCIDRIQIRADDESDQKFMVTYNLSDSDSDPSDVLVTFYYTTVEGATSGGTRFANANQIPLTSATQMIEFDTSALPNGTYYIYATATDGINAISYPAKGRLVVDHSLALAQNATVPSLTWDTPTAAANVYQGTGMIMSGWAVDDIEIAQAEVVADGTDLLGSFVPNRFYKAARTAHPTSADSSSAGFLETIDVSALSVGTHSITLKICDTHTNCTTETRTISVVAGTDPNPTTSLPDDGSDEGRLPIGEGVMSIDYSMGADGQLTFTVSNADVACGGASVELRAASANKPKKFLARSSRTLGTKTASSSLTFSAQVAKVQARKVNNRGVKLSKKKRKATTQVSFAAVCPSNEQLSDGIAVDLKGKNPSFSNTLGKQSKGSWMKGNRGQFE